LGRITAAPDCLAIVLNEVRLHFWGGRHHIDARDAGKRQGGGNAECEIKERGDQSSQFIGDPLLGSDGLGKTLLRRLTPFDRSASQTG